MPCSPPGDLPNPGIELRSHTLQVDSLLFEPPGENVCHISHWQLVIYELCVYICTYTYTCINIGPSNVDDYLVSFITLINKISVHTMWASLVAQMVKNLPAMLETSVLSLGWEDPLEEGMATHSSILAWRIPCPEGHKKLDMTE